MAEAKEATGYREAIETVLTTISPLGTDTVFLDDCVDRVAAGHLYAAVNSPSVDASLKDGFAVRSVEIDTASAARPVRLRIIGTAAAGEPCTETVTAGTAVRILTGAKIPHGANAVVAEEFTQAEGEFVTVTNTAEPGRNIFLQGSDVTLGQLVCASGERLTPGLIGILAAAGFGELPVFRNPSVAIIATGDEVVAVGRPLPDGKLYASNMATLNAWCRRYAMNTTLHVVKDERKQLVRCLSEAVSSSDAILTSGGAWTGDRDLVVHILDEMGWRKYFHRIRIGPGKAVGFGVLAGKPVFILPGGPPSNLMAFLQVALPGLLKLAGHGAPGLPEISVKTDEKIIVRDRDWTQFIFGCFQQGDGHTVFSPLQLKSRLQSIAGATGLICVPEGVLVLPKGATVLAQLLS